MIARRIARPRSAERAAPSPSWVGATPNAMRPGRFDGRQHRTAFYRWDALAPGATGSGPAVIAGGEATVVIPPRFRFTIDGFGNVIATWR